MEMPISTQRRRNSGVVISRLLGLSFFSVDVRDEVGSPQLQDLREDLVDGEHLELIKPLVDGARDRVVGVVGHDVGHVLEDLQILDLHVLTVLVLALVGGLQLREVFEDVPLELDAVEPRDGGGGAEAHLLAAYGYGFLKHLLPPLL